MPRYFEIIEDERTGRDIDVKFGLIIRDAAFVLIAFITLVMAGCPRYNVWREGLVGKAELRRAEQNRQIAIQEALALKESAIYKAQAEIERAKGVQKANQIIANGLKGHKEYLQYLWITHRVGEGVTKEVVYVPISEQLPVLEATRLQGAEQ